MNNNIGELLGKYKKKSNFQILRPQTLFEPSWDNLKKLRCPFCSNKLVKMRSGSMLCKGKKHQRRFVISMKKLNEIKK